MVDALPTRGVAAIRRLIIKNYRGIRLLTWHPSPDLNVLIGPGDASKTTILNAISLLLSPSVNSFPTEFDFYSRKFMEEIRIEAVIRLSNPKILSETGFPTPPLRGWKNNTLLDLPDENGAEPVIVCQVVVNKDFDMNHTIVGVGDQSVPFRRSLRQIIGLMRLGLQDRADRDLRLVQGGTLEQFMGNRDVRDSILQSLFKASIHEGLEQDALDKLEEIETLFEQESLPSPVRLGLIGTPGVSMAASVGLMAGSTNEDALPLTVWGAGTQKFASLAMASLVSEDHSIALVDEPESGLEPYRQRSFIQKLYSKGNRQSFIITHSPAVLEMATHLNGTIWRLHKQEIQPEPTQTEGLGSKNSHEIVLLSDNAELKKLLSKDPAALLARLVIICEGITEVGFTQVLLERLFREDYHSSGMHLVDGGGNEKALTMCEKFNAAHITYSCVVDDEGSHSGRWQNVTLSLPCLRWDNGMCTEKVVFALLPDERLLEILDWAESLNAHLPRKHSIPLVRAHLANNVQAPEGDWIRDFGRNAVMNAIIQASVYAKNPWFKSVEGGRLLATKMLELTQPPILQTKLDSFINGISKVVQ